MVQWLKTLVFLAKARGSTPSTQIAFTAIQFTAAGNPTRPDLRHQAHIQKTDTHANKTFTHIKFKKALK